MALTRQGALLRSRVGISRARSPLPPLYDTGRGEIQHALQNFYLGEEPAVAGQLRVFVGGIWPCKPVKVWNGSAWVTKPVKRWNGKSWVRLNE